MLVEFSGSQRETKQTQLTRLAKSVAGGRQEGSDYHYLQNLYQMELSFITRRIRKLYSWVPSRPWIVYLVDEICSTTITNFVHTSLCHIKLQLGCNLDIKERETHGIKLLGWFEQYSNQYLEIWSSSIIGPEYFWKHIWFNCCRWNKGSVLQLST